jgi:hypothetical protein
VNEIKKWKKFKAQSPSKQIYNGRKKSINFLKIYKKLELTQIDLINSQSRILDQDNSTKKSQNSKFNNPISNNEIENKY